MIRFADYRRRMERAASAHFAERGARVSPKASYILESLDVWHENLVRPELARLVTDERARRSGVESFPLHKYAHHGLSSQAMLFNLVLPLFEADDVDALADAFRDAGAPWPGPGAHARLEVTDRAVFAEDGGQPTSFDLCVEGPAGPPLFVEAKLVEREFGGCSMLEAGDCEGENPAGRPDRCPLHRMGRAYWTRLAELGFDTDAMRASPVCLLGPYYQFFREVAFALTRGGHFVLLVHGDNPAFWRDDGARGLWPFLTRFVPEAFRGRLHRVTLQSAAAAIAATGRHDDWIGTFRRRYALDAPAPAATTDVDAVLAALPDGVSAAIRDLWTMQVRGSKARGDGAAGRDALRRISALVQSAGVARDAPAWSAVVEHGRRLYAE
jgi:hypothetical protein